MFQSPIALPGKSLVTTVLFFSCDWLKGESVLKSVQPGDYLGVTYIFLITQGLKGAPGVCTKEQVNDASILLLSL